MLVLSRHMNEEIVISKDGVEIIRVMVVDIKGDKVRIGIGADRQFVIDRAEVLADKRENGPDRCEKCGSPLKGHWTCSQCGYDPRF